MTIFGGAGTLLGLVLGDAIIKYCVNIFSAFNEPALHRVFDFLPEWLADPVVAVSGLFFRDSWHPTLGPVFMLIVLCMPGRLTGGLAPLASMIRVRSEADRAGRPHNQPHTTD